MLEVTDSGALAQKFRVRHNADVGVGTRLADDGFDFVPSPNRHGRFGNYDGEPADRCGDFTSRSVNMREVRVAVAPSRGRAHRDEDRIGRPHGFGKRCRECQAALAAIGSHELVKAGLENRDIAPGERSDLVRILVHAGDLVPKSAKHAPIQAQRSPCQSWRYASTTPKFGDHRKFFFNPLLGWTALTKLGRV